MSIQEWAALAEIVGAVAVVASLVYLAVQIRQNTHGLSMSLKSTELAAFERNVDAGNRIREIFILNPENFAGSERLLDSHIRCSGVRDWLSSNSPDWRPQFAALVQQRVKMFDDVAEKASAEGQE